MRKEKAIHLYGELDALKKTLRGKPCKGEKLNGCVGAVQFYAESNEQCKRRVEVFLILAKRSHMPKDIVGLIAKLIWDQREDLNESDPSPDPKERSTRFKRARK